MAMVYGVKMLVILSVLICATAIADRRANSTSNCTVLINIKIIY